MKPRLSIDRHGLLALLPFVLSLTLTDARCAIWTPLVALRWASHAPIWHRRGRYESGWQLLILSTNWIESWRKRGTMVCYRYAFGTMKEH